MERLGDLTRHVLGQVPGHEVAKYAWLLAKHAGSGAHAAPPLFGALQEAPRFDRPRRTYRAS